MTELKFLNFKEHVKSRSMWIGSKLLSEQSYWVLDRNGIFRKETIAVSDGLLKTFDEILVNATDQYIRSPEYKDDEGGQVSIIDIKFNNETGKIVVTNDGRGIPVYFVEEIQQYSVQAIISREFSGSNFDDTNQDRVVGGINGLGIKLININSLYFEVETVDWVRRKYYKQICRKNMDIIEEPIIIDLNKDSPELKKLTVAQKRPHTSIIFIPDYADLCTNTNNVSNPGWITSENLENFRRLIETRVYQTSAFINVINYRYENDKKIEYKRKAKVCFNNKEIKIKNLTDFVKMFGVEQIIEFEMSGMTEIEVKKEKMVVPIKFPWSVCVGYANNEDLFGTNISIVNGVFLPKGGSHINMLYNQIKACLKDNIENITKGTNIEFSDSMLRKLLFIVDIRNIPLPQFSGQTKDSIIIGSKELNYMKKIYHIPSKIVDKTWKMIKDVIEYKILQQDLSKSSKKKKMTKIRKYEPADNLGMKSKLFIPEGDSACKPIRDIIASKNSSVNRNYHGTYNIQGVPPNACKKTKEILIDGEIKVKQDKDLQNNIAFQGLAAVLNLNYNYTYELTEQGDKEFNTLHYGAIIIAVDQDLDGVGNICSLIVVYILVFWPELIKRGFVKRLQTPLIRVYMPGKNAEVLNFYSNREYKTWVEKTYGTEDEMPENVKKGISYYKGLGGHTPEEVQDMGKNIHDNILTLTWDEIIKIKMKLFYGQDTGERKDILLSPVTMEYSDKMMQTLEVPVSTHFEIESKSFQLYFMRRKLKHAVDGMIPSQRKAFAGARIMFKKEAKAKVYQVTGYVTKKMHYQHGDTSMNETIIKMAQNFTGANNIPIFIPISNGFGDRVNGRGESASPRYIDTKYNYKIMDLIFPPEDDWLLEYMYEDGKQSEPKYYVPIIPYSILETSTTTGVGWKIDVWGRDYNWTMYNLKQMIKYDYPTEKNGVIIGKPLNFIGKVWVPKTMDIKIGTSNSGKIVSEICLGKYKVDVEKEIITITQMPIKMWSYQFKCALLGIHPKTGKTEDKDGIPYNCKEYVKSVSDNTGNDQSEVIIKLVPGSLAEINKNYGTQILSPIEDYLGLYQILTPHLNMIGIDESVKEFTAYEEVLEYWFPVRKELYKRRLARQIIILELKISYYGEILRFIHLDENKEINIDNKEQEDRDQILAEARFVKFNKTNLLNPEYTKTNELKECILNIGSSYKYIDDITKGMTGKKAILDLEKKVKEYQEQLDILKEKTWSELWLSELEKLEAVMAEGLKTNWLFSTKQHVFKKVAKRSAKKV